MVRAKFRGGPMNGQVSDVQDYADRLRVRDAEKINYRDWEKFSAEPYSDMQLKFKDGDYARSNMRLKNGTIIYIWMGWRE